MRADVVVACHHVRSSPDGEAVVMGVERLEGSDVCLTGAGREVGAEAAIAVSVVVLGEPERVPQLVTVQRLVEPVVDPDRDLRCHDMDVVARHRLV